jgi:hypothetical protein
VHVLESDSVVFRDGFDQVTVEHGEYLRCQADD